MSAVEKAAEVLAAHGAHVGGTGLGKGYWFADCLATDCPWVEQGDGSLVDGMSAHRGHVAQALADAGLLDDPVMSDHTSCVESYTTLLLRAEAAERALATLREDVAREIEAARSRHWQQHLTDHPHADAKSCPADYAKHDAYFDAARIARGTR